jgi:hypothetical protein
MSTQAPAAGETEHTGAPLTLPTTVGFLGGRLISAASTTAITVPGEQLRLTPSIRFPWPHLKRLLRVRSVVEAQLHCESESGRSVINGTRPTSGRALWTRGRDGDSDYFDECTPARSAGAAR